MNKKAKPTLLIVGETGLQPNSPPRKLGKHGVALWRSVCLEYNMEDAAGREMLCAACQALDRAESCREIIDDQGELMHTKHGPKENPLCKVELGNRAFVVRTLAKLGIDLEPVGRVGRPTRFPGSA